MLQSNTLPWNTLLPTWKFIASIFCAVDNNFSVIFNLQYLELNENLGLVNIKFSTLFLYFNVEYGIRGTNFDILPSWDFLDFNLFTQYITYMCIFGNSVLILKVWHNGIVKIAIIKTLIDLYMVQTQDV